MTTPSVRRYLRSALCPLRWLRDHTLWRATNKTARMPQEIATPHHYIAAFLDEIADELKYTYDEWEGGLHRRLVERLVELSAASPGEACLDIGGVVGITHKLLMNRVGGFGLVTSIDIAKPVLDMARLLHAFRDSSFDVVVVSRSLTYLVSPGEIMREAQRVLKPGGRTAVFCRRESLSTPAERAFFTVIGRLKFDRQIGLPDHFSGQSPLGEPAVLEALLRDLGFNVGTYSNLIMGGKAADAEAWNDVMMQTWPAARFLLGGLPLEGRLAFNADLDDEMQRLGDGAYRYHHPYLFMTAVKPTHRLTVVPVPDKSAA